MAARRPPRRVPALSTIAKFHQLGDEPFCLRCKWKPPVRTWAKASAYLDRAHMIDRADNGLDAVQNIAPLCSWCHRWQPRFRDPLAALDWFGLDNHPAVRWPGITTEDYTWQDDIPYLLAL